MDGEEEEDAGRRDEDGGQEIGSRRIMTLTCVFSSATAVAHCKAGKGLLKVNGQPLHLVKPEVLRFKVYEPLLIVGLEQFANVDIRVRVTGGGHTSQVYAIRQAIAKSIVAYFQKFVDEHSKNHIKQLLVQYDRTLLVADNRRCEPKKFGGPGARARYQSTPSPLSDNLSQARWKLIEVKYRVLPLNGVFPTVFCGVAALVGIARVTVLYEILLLFCLAAAFYTVAEEEWGQNKQKARFSSSSSSPPILRLFVGHDESMGLDLGVINESLKWVGCA